MALSFSPMKASQAGEQKEEQGEESKEEDDDEEKPAPPLLLFSVDYTGRLTVWSLRPHLAHSPSAIFNIDLEILQDMQISVNLQAISLAAGGELIACGGNDNTLSLVEWRKEKKVKLQETSGPLLAVKFSPTGHLLAFGGCNNTVSVLRMANKRMAWERRVAAAVDAIKFSPRRRLLAVGSDKKLTVLEAESGEIIYEHDVGGFLMGLDFSHDGKFISFGGYDQRVTTVELSTFETARERSTADDADVAVWALLHMGDRKLLTFFRNAAVFTEESLFEASCEEEGGGIVQELEIDGGVNALSFSRDGQLLALGGRKSWSTTELGIGHTTNEATDNEALAISLSPDGRRIALGGESGTVTIVRLSLGESAAEQAREATSLGCTVRALKFSPVNGGLLAVGGGNRGEEQGNLTLLDAENLEVRRENKTRRRVNALDFSPDGQLVAFGGNYFKMTVMEVETGRVRHEHKMSEFLFATSFSADGTLLALGGRDNKVTVLAVDSWTGVSEIEMSHSLFAISFSPEKTHLAVGGEDQKVTLLDTASCEIIQQVDVGGAVRALCFSTVGPTLVAGVENKGLSSVLVPKKTPTTVDMLLGASMRSAAPCEDAVARALLRAPGLACCCWEELLPPAELRRLLADDFENTQGGLGPQHLPLELLTNSSRNELPMIIEAVLTQTAGRLLLAAAEGLPGRLLTFLQRAATDRSDESPWGLGMPELLVHAFAAMDRQIITADDSPGQQQICYARCLTKSRWAGICHLSADKEEAWTNICQQKPSPVAQQPVKRQVLLCPGLAQPKFLRCLLHLPPQLQRAVFDTETASILVNVLWHSLLVRGLLGVRVALHVFATIAAYVFPQLPDGPKGLPHQLACLLPTTFTVALELLEVLGVARCRWTNPPKADMAGMTIAKGKEKAEEQASGTMRETKRKLKLFLLSLTSHYFGWNSLDLLPHILICTAVLASQHSQGEDGALRVVNSLLGLLWLSLGANSLQFLRGFDRTSHLVRLLTETFFDMIPFMFIMSIVLVSVAQAMRLVLPEESPGIGSLQDAMLMVMGMGVLGGFDLARTSNGGEAELDYSSWSVPALALHFALVLFVLVIMMNSLIAIMGSTYERVMGLAIVTARIQKAEVAMAQFHLLEALPCGLGEVIFKKVPALTAEAFFHRLVPAYSFSVEETTTAEVQEEEEWQSAATMLKKQMKRLENGLEAKSSASFETMKHRLEQLENALEARSLRDLNRMQLHMEHLESRLEAKSVAKFNMMQDRLDQLEKSQEARSLASFQGMHNRMDAAQRALAGKLHDQMEEKFTEMQTNLGAIEKGLTAMHDHGNRTRQVHRLSSGSHEAGPARAQGSTNLSQSSSAAVRASLVPSTAGTRRRKKQPNTFLNT